MNHRPSARKTMHSAARAIALPAALVLALPSAFAQDSAAPNADRAARAQQMAAKMQERFTAADANGDGKLTKEEAKAKMPFVYKHFDEIDTGHTGAVTLADIAAYAKTRHAARKAG